MNPLHNTPVCVSNEGVEQSEPKTTAEKIGRQLNKQNEAESQNHFQTQLWRVEREGSEAIRMLCEEIDELKNQLSVVTLKQKLKK